MIVKCKVINLQFNKSIVKKIKKTQKKKWLVKK